MLGRIFVIYDLACFVDYSPGSYKHTGLAMRHGHGGQGPERAWPETRPRFWDAFPKAMGSLNVVPHLQFGPGEFVRRNAGISVKFVQNAHHGAVHFYCMNYFVA